MLKLHLVSIRWAPAPIANPVTRWLDGEDPEGGLIGVQDSEPVRLRPGPITPAESEASLSLSFV